MSRGAPDYSGMKVDVVLRSEWASVKGLDKHITGFKALDDYEDYGYAVQYEVEAEKVFYITGFYCVGWAQIAANAELPLPFRVELEVGGAPMARAGGYFGGWFVLPSPVAVQAGYEAKVLVVNLSNHGVSFMGGAVGYELGPDDGEVLPE